MLLIEKIGLRPVGNQNKTFGIYICESCDKRLERVVAEEKRRPINSVCQSCANTTSSTTHSRSKTGLYKRWSTMKSRCSNKYVKGYKNYGGRGIVVCDEWVNSFGAFYEWAMNNGYDSALTIDRINNDGNYEPSNCRWADRFVQASNKRNSIKK